LAFAALTVSNGGIASIPPSTLVPLGDALWQECYNRAQLFKPYSLKSEALGPFIRLISSSTKSLLKADRVDK
jgi:hypothetical protein